MATGSMKRRSVAVQDVKPSEMQASIDDMLSRVATPIAPVKAVAPTLKKRHRSRFFFSMFEDEIASLKREAVPVKPEPENKEAIQYAEALGKTLPPVLKENIVTVRDFFIKEIAPLTLALGAGASQASEAIKAVTGSEVELSTLVKFEKMAHHAVVIKMSHFIERFLKLPANSTGELISAANPSQPKRFPDPYVPQEPESESGNRRETRALKRKLQQVLDQNGGMNNGPVEG